MLLTIICMELIVVIHHCVNVVLKEKLHVKHYLLKCPRFAAQRSVLLTSAAQLYVAKHGWRVAIVKKLVVCCMVVKI